MRRLAALAWEALLFELALYRALARWVARRPDVPHDARAVGYGRLAAPMIWLFVFGSAIEVVALDLVLHRWWPALRIPMLALGVWGLVWMLGLLASYRTRPHLFTPTALVLRSGPRTRVEVPWDAIADAHPVEHELPGVLKSLHQDGDLLLVGVSSRTNVEITLGEPTPLGTSGGVREVRRVGLWADEPREVARLLRDRRSALPR